MSIHLDSDIIPRKIKSAADMHIGSISEEPWYGNYCDESTFAKPDLSHAHNSPLRRKRTYTRRKSADNSQKAKKKKVQKNNTPRPIWKPHDFKEWSPKKQRLWLEIVRNPDSFYFVHCAPNEIQKFGEWDSIEKERFELLMKQRPPRDGKWGLFSLSFYGRSGKQCKEYFEKIMESTFICSSPNECPNENPREKKDDALEKSESQFFEGDAKDLDDIKPEKKPSNSVQKKLSKKKVEFVLPSSAEKASTVQDLAPECHSSKVQCQKTSQDVFVPIPKKRKVKSNNSKHSTKENLPIQEESEISQKAEKTQRADTPDSGAKEESFDQPNILIADLSASKCRSDDIIDFHSSISSDFPHWSNFSSSPVKESHESSQEVDDVAIAQSSDNLDNLEEFERQMQEVSLLVPDVEIDDYVERSAEEIPLPEEKFSIESMMFPTSFSEPDLTPQKRCERELESLQGRFLFDLTRLRDCFVQRLQSSISKVRDASKDIVLQTVKIWIDQFYLEQRQFSRFQVVEYQSARFREILLAGNCVKPEWSENIPKTIKLPQYQIRVDPVSWEVMTELTYQ